MHILCNMAVPYMPVAEGSHDDDMSIMPNASNSVVYAPYLFSINMLSLDDTLAKFDCAYDKFTASREFVGAATFFTCLVVMSSTAPTCKFDPDTVNMSVFPFIAVMSIYVAAKTPPTLTFVA